MNEKINQPSLWANGMVEMDGWGFRRLLGPTGKGRMEEGP